MSKCDRLAESVENLRNLTHDLGAKLLDVEYENLYLRRKLEGLERDLYAPDYSEREHDHRRMRGIG